MEKYKSPDQLLPAIKSRWDKVSWSRSSKAVLPPDKHLIRMLQTAFQASLRSEEGRPLNFRLAYCAPEELRRDVRLRRRNTPVRFSRPRELTVSEVVGLAPAADPH